jgi:hypothetical protein
MVGLQEFKESLSETSFMIHQYQNVEEVLEESMNGWRF